MFITGKQRYKNFLRFFVKLKKSWKNDRRSLCFEKMAEVEEKTPGEGETWFQAWNQDRSTRFEPKFIELFNDQMNEKGGVTLDAETGGKYLMTVNTFFTEPGFNVGVMRKNACVSLRATFTDKDTGEIVAVIGVNDSAANSFWGMDFDVAYRIQESYAKAGRELAKFLIKKLKL